MSSRASGTRVRYPSKRTLIITILGGKLLVCGHACVNGMMTMSMQVAGVSPYEAPLGSRATIKKERKDGMS